MSNKEKKEAQKRSLHLDRMRITQRAGMERKGNAAIVSTHFTSKIARMPVLYVLLHIKYVQQWRAES